jgi:predicted ATPase
LIRQVIAADHPEPLPVFSPPTIQRSAAVTARLYGFPQLDTPFWGREAECAQLCHQIVEQNDRVVVLTGMGGVGKTRLAQEMAQQLLPHFTDGACFVSLSELSAGAGPEEISLEQTQVVHAIAHAVGLVLAPDPLPLTQLFYYFAQRRLLLVLDNVERRPALLTLVSELLRRAPRLVLLLTSRHRLPIAAAFTLRVPGFSISNPATSAELSGAVQFFCQEAQRHAAPLTLDSTTLTHIASICRAVRGLPLALKLAAHLAVHRPCAEIAQNLWEPGRLSFLESPVAATQLQSLRTVFNSSWRQLSAPLQSVYVRCSLFCSSFGGEAAAAVAGAAAAELIALCDCSLLERDAEGLLALHPLLREYAADYALVLGLLVETQRSYMRYWLQQVASSVKQELGGAAIAAQLARLDPYLADLQQAWLLAVKAQELDLLAEALPTLERFFRLKMYWQEGDHLLAQTMKLLASCTSENLQARQVSVQIATARVRLLLLLHQVDIALSTADRAVLEATALAEPALLVPALIALGHARSSTEELEQAERLARQALALAETTQNFWAAAEAEVLLSKVLRTQNHIQSACVYAERALRRYQQIGDDSGVLDCIRQLILGYKNFGNPRAQQLLRQGIALAKAIENLYIASHFQLIFSMGFAVYEGLHTEALAYCSQIQSDSQIRMIPELASRSFYVQAWIEANLGQFDAARVSARQGLQTAQAADLAFCQAKAISVMAVIEYYAENFLSAYRYTEELRDFAHTANLPSMSRDGLLLAAYALLQMGRVQSVRSTLHELDRLLHANELIYQSESNALHAQLALAANDLPQCRHYGQAIWGYLQQNVCAFNHISPFFLYWTSYRALHVAGDPADQEVLAQANGLLDHLLQQLKAGNREVEDTMSQRFIENNRWRRELRQAWHANRDGL